MVERDRLRRARKILFVHQLLAMGDAFFLSPIYKVIKENIPTVEIAILTNHYSIPFVKAIPYVDQGYSLESLWRKDSSRLERLFYLCLFLFRNRFDAIVLRGDKRIPQRVFHVAAKICRLHIISIGSYLEEEITETRHIVDTYFNILERMGFQVNERGRLYVDLPNSALSEAKVFLKERIDRLVGVDPISQMKVKTWPPEKTATLIKQLREMSYDVVLFCTDSTFIDRVQSCLNNEPITVVSYVDFSLLRGIIALCHAFVGVDTGLTHLAAALGVPTVGLYGPTSGIILRPYNAKGIAIQSSVDCPYYRPLSLFSPKEKFQECYIEDKCKLSMTNCVQEIAVEEVIKAIMRLLKESKHLGAS